MALVITSQALRMNGIRHSSWKQVSQHLHPKLYRQFYCSVYFQPSNSCISLIIALALGSALGLSFAFHEVYADGPLGMNEGELKHPRVANLWEKPGVYAWGCNKERLLDIETNKDCLTSALSIKAFEGQALRDIHLGENLGVVVNADGDLVQWGTGYSDDKTPEKTLEGKNIIKISIDSERILALSKNGKVHVVPISKHKQQTGPKPIESNTIPLSTSKAKLSYETLDIPLSWGEKISDITMNNSLSLFATSKGRLFIQTLNTTPTIVESLKDIHVVQVASGDNHALARSSDGKVFTIGSNMFGQLGLEYNAKTSSQTELTQQPLSTLYPGEPSPKCIDVSAGGNTTYFSVLSPTGNVDVWASGYGLTGQLGNNSWTQAQSIPVKVRNVSGMSEFDEVLSRLAPIKPRYISTSSSHTFIVLNSCASGYGNDVYAIGSNYEYQLGNGKRSSVSLPTVIPGLTGGRMQLMPKQKLKCKTPNGRMKTMTVEQRIWAGKKVSVVYTAAV